jgi:hypothetical protein
MNYVNLYWHWDRECENKEMFIEFAILENKKGIVKVAMDHFEYDEKTLNEFLDYAVEMNSYWKLKEILENSLDFKRNGYVFEKRDGNSIMPMVRMSPLLFGNRVEILQLVILDSRNLFSTKLLLYSLKMAMANQMKDVAMILLEELQGRKLECNEYNNCHNKIFKIAAERNQLKILRAISCDKRFECSKEKVTKDVVVACMGSYFEIAEILLGHPLLNNDGGNVFKDYISRGILNFKL